MKSPHPNPYHRIIDVHADRVWPSRSTFSCTLSVFLLGSFFKVPKAKVQTRPLQSVEPLNYRQLLSAAR